MAVGDLLQWIVAVVIILAGAIAAFAFWTRSSSDAVAAHASTEQRRKIHDELLKEGGKLRDFETAEFLLGAAVDLYDRKMKAFDTLDDKAQKLIALVGGGASLYTVLGWFGQPTYLRFSPLLVAAAVFFFFSVAVLLVALYPRERDLIALTEFNSVAILAAKEFRPRVAHRLIEAWQALTFEMTPVLRTKGKCIYLSMFSIALGAALLLANFLLLLHTPPKQQTSATSMKCTVAALKNNGATVSCRSGQ